MPSVAESPSLPTVTVTVCAVAKRVAPSMVAVTRTVLTPPSSAILLCTLFVPVSASTVSVMPLGAASSSVMVPVAWAVAIVAPTAPVSSTRKVSFSSSSTSSVVATVKV